jgi:hypothetical protein
MTTAEERGGNEEINEMTLSNNYWRERNVCFSQGSINLKFKYLRET